MCIYLKARILPAFGRMPLDEIGPKDITAWALVGALPGRREPKVFLFPRHAEHRSD